MAGGGGGVMSDYSPLGNPWANTANLQAQQQQADANTAAAQARRTQYRGMSQEEYELQERTKAALANQPAFSVATQNWTPTYGGGGAQTGGGGVAGGGGPLDGLAGAGPQAQSKGSAADSGNSIGSELAASVAGFNPAAGMVGPTVGTLRQGLATRSLPQAYSAIAGLSKAY
jgi:hypothetical protein